MNSGGYKAPNVTTIIWICGVAYAVKWVGGELVQRRLR